MSRPLSFMFLTVGLWKSNSYILWLNQVTLHEITEFTKIQLARMRIVVRTVECDLPERGCGIR